MALQHQPSLRQKHRSRCAHVVGPRRRRCNDVLRATCIFHEHLLHEMIRFIDVVIVMPLTNGAEIGELLNAELSTAITERFEGVFRLTSHHDIANEARVIALARSICQLSRHSECRSSGAFQRAANVVERTPLSNRSGDGPLEIVEHALMLAHPRNVARTEISKACILGLRLVIDDGAKKRVMLRDGVVDLSPQKIDSSFHRCARSRDVSAVRAQGAPASRTPYSSSVRTRRRRSKNSAGSAM